MTTCTRCGKQRPTMPIYIVRAGGHTWGSMLAPSPPQLERICGDCITDDEIVRELGPMMEFALGVLLKGISPEFPSTMVALETARAFFMVRNNDPDDRGRAAAVRALGLGGE